MSFVPLFTQHSRSWRDNRYVYPVISRRSKGLSIGVNLNPDKICNFDCIYCSVDRTVPATVLDVDLQTLGQELMHMLTFAASGEIWKHPPFDSTPAELRRINDIAFSGDGEPTSFPSFESACRLAVDAISSMMNNIATSSNPACGLASPTTNQPYSYSPPKIVVITNATLFHRPRVQRALSFLDSHNGELWTKLDAGTETYYRLVERTSIPLSRVLENILLAGKARPIVIQSLFMNIHDLPPADDEIEHMFKGSSSFDRAGVRSSWCRFIPSPAIPPRNMSRRWIGNGSMPSLKKHAAPVSTSRPITARPDPIH